MVLFVSGYICISLGVGSGGQQAGGGFSIGRTSKHARRRLRHVRGRDTNWSRAASRTQEMNTQGRVVDWDIPAELGEVGTEIAIPRFLFASGSRCASVLSSGEV